MCECLMIDRIRRMMRGTEPVEELVSAYVDAGSDEEVERVEGRLRAAGVDVEELRTVRETARMLRSVGTVEVPRSFALTPETLADQGYSIEETEKILNPRVGQRGIGLRGVLVAGSLTAVVVAAIGVAALTIGDISRYSTESVEQLDVGSQESVIPAGRGEAIDVAPAAIEIEKEVAGEAVVVTVVVERAVEVAGEAVAFDASVVEEMEIETKEIAEAEVLPTPAVARVEMVSEAVTIEEASVDEADRTPLPTRDPCVVQPTVTPTPGSSPSASTAPKSTVTMAPTPTCTPTPTPSPTPTATPSR